MRALASAASQASGRAIHASRPASSASIRCASGLGGLAACGAGLRGGSGRGPGGGGGGRRARGGRGGGGGDGGGAAVAGAGRGARAPGRRRRSAREKAEEGPFNRNSTRMNSILLG